MTPYYSINANFTPVTRRSFLALAAAAAAARPLTAWAQSSGVRKIGVLVSGSPPHPFFDALRGGLRELGYVDGKNITFEVRYGEGRYDRVAAHAAELVKLGVDIIVAHFTPAAKAAKEATRTIPVVMAPAGAPLQTGLVASLARPGGNVTGLSAMAAELGGKRLELLSQAIPKLAKVAVLASTPDPFTKPFLSDLQAAAARAGIQLQPVMVNGPADFPDAFAAMARAEAQAVIVQPLFDSHHATTIPLAAKHRLPIMSADRATLVAGGLMSFWVDEEVLFKRAAVFVDKILKGAKPADLPVERPTKFVLAINLKTAKALGFVISPSLLAGADEVIE
jgi:putative ABC transport system substrate-binding protein